MIVQKVGVKKYFARTLVKKHMWHSIMQLDRHMNEWMVSLFLWWTVDCGLDLRGYIRMEFTEDKIVLNSALAYSARSQISHDLRDRQLNLFRKQIYVDLKTFCWSWTEDKIPHFQV